MMTPIPARLEAKYVKSILEKVRDESGEVVKDESGNEKVRRIGQLKIFRVRYAYLETSDKACDSLVEEYDGKPMAGKLFSVVIKAFDFD